MTTEERFAQRLSVLVEAFEKSEKETERLRNAVNTQASCYGGHCSDWVLDILPNFKCV